jgi:hypothetical protein
VLRVAIDTYTRCLRDPGCDEKLAADARYNQGRARLLLLQVPPSQDADRSDDPGHEEGPDDERDGPKEEPKKRDGPGNGGEQKPGPGAKDTENGTGEDRQKGAGAAGGAVPRPPVSDRPDASNLPRDEADALLREASQRIVEDWLKYRREMKRPSSPGARDW